MRLRAVVFDFDGTLAATSIDFDLMRRRAIEVLQRWGAWHPGLARGRYTLELIRAAADRLAACGTDPAAMVAEAHDAIKAVELQACATATLHDGAREALDRLAAAGVPAAIITRNCAEAVSAILSRHPLPVSVVVARDQAPAVKPDPRHLLAALSRLGVEPADAALVGDHVTDVQCARAAGAVAVAIAGITTPAEELRRAGAHFVATSLVEAVDFLLEP